MNKGKLIVFSAPSGSGKTTIVKHLLKQPELNLEFSISATSREKRGEEINGKDYYFLTAKEFISKIKKDEFLDFLKSKKFKLNSNSNIYLKVDNDVYSSDEIFDIYDLYNFKRECFQNELISPFPNDSKKNNENILSFTPIKIEEFYKENYLFPPKSTWITPRI